MALQIGAGEPQFAGEFTLTPAIVNAATAADQSFTVAGVRPDVMYLVSWPTLEAGLHVSSVAICTTAGTLKLRFSNPTAGNITPAAKLVKVIGL